MAVQKAAGRVRIHSFELLRSFRFELFRKIIISIDLTRYVLVRATVLAGKGEQWERKRGIDPLNEASQPGRVGPSRDGGRASVL